MDGKIIGDSNSLFIKLDGFENLSQLGFRVKDVLAKLYEIDSGKVVVIGVGVNDCAIIIDTESGNRLDPNLDEFRTDYQVLIELAKTKFTKVVALGLISSTEEVAKLEALEIQYLNKTIEEFNEIIKTICSEKEVRFVDLLRRFLCREEELLVDHIHPNKKGVEVICSELKRAGLS